MKPLSFMGLAALMLLLAGCSTAEFYWQGITGQIDLLGNRALSAVDLAEASIGGPLETPDHDPLQIALLVDVAKRERERIFGM